MQPALGGMASSLEWVLKNLDLITYGIGAYLVATKTATIGTNAIDLATKAWGTTSSLTDKALKILTASTISQTTVTNLATTATKAFNLALLKNPLIIGGVVIAGGIYAVADALSVFNSELDKGGNSVSEATQLKIKEIEANDALTESTKKAEIALLKRRDAQKKVNDEQKAEEAKSEKARQELEKIQTNLAFIKNKLN